MAELEARSDILSMITLQRFSAWKQMLMRLRAIACARIYTVNRLHI